MYYLFKGNTGNMIVWKDDPNKDGFANFYSILSVGSEWNTAEDLKKHIEDNWIGGSESNACFRDPDFLFSSEDYDELVSYAAMEML